MQNKKAICWFRQDLRLHDNEALSQAISSADIVYPVYVFDTRTMGDHGKYGFRKTGKYRAKFLIESIVDLKKSLSAKGLDLIIRIGQPEKVIYELANELKTSWVFCNRERTTEELYVQDQLEQNLWTIGQEVRYSRGKMLFYTADLPFPVNHTPDTFTTFRKEVERFTSIRKVINCDFDKLLPHVSNIEIGEVPQLSDFNYEDDFEPYLPGGETAGLTRLQSYLWDTDHIAAYKKTRNGSFGMDYSSKFSAYLAHGCLSPKQIYWELQRYEEERTKNDSTYWMVFELMWRDYFRLIGKKYEEKIFLKGGIKETEREDLTDNMNMFQIWAEGRTGYPFVDASMIQLNETGFMSNRGRQNVASFLINDMHVNWQIGAEYFESLLIDYDPCSNWGNWIYIAGVGNDPRENRYFNTVLQSKKYDSNGDFIKAWCPGLKSLPPSVVHYPSAQSDDELLKYDVILGRDFPKPIIKSEQLT